MSMPKTSRRPSLFTPTATITATDTIRLVAADLHVGGVQPDIRPLAFERAVEKRLHPLIDLLTEPADLAFRDAGSAHRLYEVVDRAGRDAVDVSLLDDGAQRLLRHPARLQKAREV
jgi:hypothetical protein